MFASFFRSRATSAAPAQGDTKAKDVESDDGSDDSEDAKVSLDLQVEAGSGKGWPENATVLLYHRIQGLICVGTEGGSIYVFGDGFQYVRPWLTNDPNNVVSLVAVYPNKVLAAFADNSIAVMELPSLNIVDLLQSTWLGPKEGDITSIFSDIVSEKPFVFVGTSNGNVHVLDVMESAVRLCDPILSISDFGLAGQGLTVADLNLCPKDERYLAVGFDGPSIETGAIVVFDLVKHKVHKTFKVPGITSLAWHHTGDALYAGTATGSLLALNVERGTFQVCWTSADEVINEDDDGDSLVPVRRITWLGPQTPTSEGCLFLLLSSSGADNDNLKNVVLGLSPQSSLSELQVVFSLPPVQCEKVINFRVVPTYTKGQNGAGAGSVTPALLLLTQRQNENHRHLNDRRLRIVRCPTTPIADWALEIGAIPDPRIAREVLPGNAEVTCVHGILPDFGNPLSVGRALVEGVINDEGKVVQTAVLKRAPSAEGMLNDEESEEPSRAPPRASRRLSARAFFAHQLNLRELEAGLEEDAWEMVLACGQHEEHSHGDRGWRNQDVLLVGHADGSIVAYGVSLPAGSQEVGRGDIWLPLCVLRCSSGPVSCLASSPSCGLVAAGDEAGVLVLYEVHDPCSGLGAVEALDQVAPRLQADIDQLLSASPGSPLPALRDFHDADVVQRLGEVAPRRACGLREVYRTKLAGGKVTSLLLLPALHRVYVGLEDGSLYVSTDLHGWQGRCVASSSSSPQAGDGPDAVVSLQFGYLPVGVNLQAAVFVYRQTGRLDVLDVLQASLLVSWPGLKVLEALRGEADGEGRRVTGACVLTRDNSVAEAPPAQAVLYAAARAARYAGQAAAAAASGSVEGTGPASPPGRETSGAASPPPVPASAPAPVPEEPKRRSFFGARLSAKASPPPPPPPPSSASSSSSGAVDRPRSETETQTQTQTQTLRSVRFLDFSLDQIPAKLCFVHCRHLVTFDLRRLGEAAMASLTSSSPSPGPGARKDSMSSLADMLQAVSVKELCPRPVIATHSLHLCTDMDEARPDESAAWTHYLGCVDTDGDLHLVDAWSRRVRGTVRLLEGVADDRLAVLQTGALLPHGTAYLVHRGSMLFSCALQSPDVVWKTPAPDRASPYSLGVEAARQLATGREAMLAATKAAVRKRRSSVITLTAGPTDLYKLFAKTREARLKDDRGGRDGTGGQPPAGTSPAGEEDGGRRAARNTGRLAANDMAQLRDNLEERGEHINRIVLKMEDFKQSAADFRATARAQKEQLQRKNERWGLF